MKLCSLVVVCAVACTGCTTLSLERQTLAQAASSGALRYQEVLNNLAMIANDPSALPAYSSIFAGTASVTDMGQFTSTTVWQHLKDVAVQNGFGSEAINPQISRAVLENWSLDPIVVPEKLEAMRAACQWMIYGPEMLSSLDHSLLASPDVDPSPGRHFGVEKQLAQLPPGWLGCGKRKDVPRGACYRAHCGHTWVWVMPEGTEALATKTTITRER